MSGRRDRLPATVGFYGFLIREPSRHRCREPPFAPVRNAAARVRNTRQTTDYRQGPPQGQRQWNRFSIGTTPYGGAGYSGISKGCLTDTFRIGCERTRAPEFELSVRRDYLFCLSLISDKPNVGDRDGRIRKKPVIRSMTIFLGSSKGAFSVGSPLDRHFLANSDSSEIVPKRFLLFDTQSFYFLRFSPLNVSNRRYNIEFFLKPFVQHQ